ncbi:tetR family transcriptional regulator [Mycobacterium xenopi 3993]|nr:tetR family transcriptional regulator [Mycobacterium xenopi 3993]
MDSRASVPRRSGAAVQRRGLELLTNLLVDLSGSLGFRRAGLPPLTRHWR